MKNRMIGFHPSSFRLHPSPHPSAFILSPPYTFDVPRDKKTLRDRFAGLGKTARRHGVGAAIAYFLDRLAGRLLALDVSRLLWLELERLQESPSNDGGEPLAFRFLTAAEVRTFAADPESRLDAAMADALARGRGLCFAAFSGGRLAAYGWLALGSVDPQDCGGVGLELPADAAYFYNGFTVPEFRGRGLYAALIGRSLQAISDRGVSHLLLSVHWTNWAALRSSRRLGCRDLGWFVGILRGRFRLIFSPRAARRLGIGFLPSAGYCPIGRMRVT
jgi:ribosomal protein S18 acetylase RimI-like enzyme